MKDIIVIDDDQIYCFVFETMIKRAAPLYKIKIFNNPIEALAPISKDGINPLTLILLDLNMPEMSGWDFLEQFEKLKIDCIGFIVTSSIDLVDKENANKYSLIKGFYSKPMTMEDLNIIVTKYG